MVKVLPASGCRQPANCFLHARGWYTGVKIDGES